jgi:hypothetical protein
MNNQIINTNKPIYVHFTDDHIKDLENMTYEQTLDNLRDFFINEKYTTNMNEKDMDNTYYLCEKVKVKQFIISVNMCALNTKLLGLVCDIIYKFVMNPDIKNKILKNFQDEMTSYLYDKVKFKTIMQRTFATTYLFKYISILFPMCTNENETKLIGTKTKFNQGYFGRNAAIIHKYKNNNQSIKTSGRGSSRKSRKSRRTNTRHSSKLKINTLKKT